MEFRVGFKMRDGEVHFVSVESDDENRALRYIQANVNLCLAERQLYEISDNLAINPRYIVKIWV
jgi:hypothetical protein